MWHSKTWATRYNWYTLGFFLTRADQLSRVRTGTPLRLESSARVIPFSMHFLSMGVMSSLIVIRFTDNTSGMFSPLIIMRLCGFVNSSY